MKAKDLRERSLDDLKELEKSVTAEKFQNRLKNFTNRLDNTSLIKKARRDLARIKTVIAQQAARGLAQDGGEGAVKAVAKKKAAAKKAAPKAAVKAAVPKATPSKPAASKPAPKAAASKPAAKKTTKKSEA